MLGLRRLPEYGQLIRQRQDDLPRAGLDIRQLHGPGCISGCGTQCLLAGVTLWVRPRAAQLGPDFTSYFHLPRVERPQPTVPRRIFSLTSYQHKLWGECEGAFVIWNNTPYGCSFHIHNGLFLAYPNPLSK